MIADPEPNYIAIGLYRQYAVIQPNSCRPEAANFLEMERGVFRVCLQ